MDTDESKPENVELTKKDYDAADELLALHPCDPMKHEVVRRLYAEMHSNLGRSKFQLRFGLREPVNQYEKLTAALLQGKLSDQEFQLRWREHSERPIDVEMIDSTYDGLAKLLESYSKALHLIDDAYRTSDPRSRSEIEQDASKCVRSTGRKLGVASAEITAVYDLVVDARVERGFDIIKEGEFRGASASDLVLQVLGYFKSAWETCVRRSDEHNKSQNRNYHATEDATSLFWKYHYDKFPRPQTLLNLLEHERSIAHHAHKRQRGHPTNVTINQVSSLSVENADNVNVQAPPPTTNPKTMKSMTRFEFKSWSDLGIGIEISMSDGKTRFLAFTSCPNLGERVRKQSATELSLPKGRITNLLLKIAEFGDGVSISIDEAARALNITLPISTHSNKSLAERRALEDDLKASSSPKPSAIRNELSDAIKEMNRQLRQRLDRRIDSEPPFKLEDNVVRIAFCVRLLIPNPDDSVRFGDGTGN